jgi:hypothetical protein
MSQREARTSRVGVELTHLDHPLFDGAGVTKRDLVDYLDAVADRILPVLRDRPLSVIRVRPGQPPFMQKNLPRYAPDWLARTAIWAEASQRSVSYPLCQDRRTLLWLANQRAVEYHPTLARDAQGSVRELVIDLDPPEEAPFRQVVLAARLVRQVLQDCGLAAAVKTNGAKGCTSSFRSTGRPPRMPPRRPGRWPSARQGWIPASRPPNTCAPTAAGRCSWTPPGLAAQRWWLPTHRGRDPTCRSPSRSPGTTSTRSPLPISPFAARLPCSAAPTPGRRSCLRPRACRPTWSSRVTAFR